MKHTHILLAVYILLLAVYPCSDSMTCADESKLGYTLVDNNDHDHSEAEDDVCSPFCECACCSIQIQQPVQGSISIAAPLMSKTVFPLLESDVRYCSYAVWQPPKA